MTPRRGRAGGLATWAVVGVVALVATLAALDAVRGGGAPSDVAGDVDQELEGDLIPRSGELDGTLVFTTLAGCRTQTLELESLSVGPAGPSLRCGLWVPPRGELAAVSLEPALALRGSRLALLRIDDVPELVGELGIARGEPAWSNDGERLAWCDADGGTTVLTAATGERERVEGCRPTITPRGSVLTRSAAPLATTLLEDGEVLLRRADLLEAFPADSDGPLDLVGYDQRPDGLLAVVVVRFETGRSPRRLLELWQDGDLVDAILLPELTLPAGAGRLGDRVEFGPTGREVVVAYPGAGTQMAVVDLVSREVVVEPRNQHGFAWSPDGTWLAVSTGEEIRVHGPDRREPVYVLPVGAAALAWR